MAITAVSWNIDNDGGEGRELFGQSLTVVNSLQPDLYFRQEFSHPKDRGAGRFAATELALDMEGFVSAPNSGAVAHKDIATAIFVKADGDFRVMHQREVRRPWWLYPTHLVVNYRGCSAPLNLLSFHHCYYDATTRESEARWITTLAHPGMVTIAIGDTNSGTPDEITPPDRWPDTAHWEHRGRYNAEGWTPDCRSDEILGAVGFDAARVIAERQDGRSEAMAATAGHHPGSYPQRIDRAYLFGLPEDAVLDVYVHDTSQTRAISDHLPLVVVLDEHVLETVLMERARDKKAMRTLAAYATAARLAEDPQNPGNVREAAARVAGRQADQLR
ncbi:hypothetical protein ACWGIB_10795 [Streptomyces xiamenensis]